MVIDLGSMDVCNRSNVKVERLRQAVFSPFGDAPRFCSALSNPRKGTSLKRISVLMLVFLQLFWSRRL